MILKLGNLGETWYTSEPVKITSKFSPTVSVIPRLKIFND